MERDQSELSEMGSACLFTVAMVTRFIKTGRVTPFWKLDGSVDDAFTSYMHEPQMWAGALVLFELICTIV